MCIVERLFSSSLVALVELSNPRKLRVCHFKVNTVQERRKTQSLSKCQSNLVEFFSAGMLHWPHFSLFHLIYGMVWFSFFSDSLTLH